MATLFKSAALTILPHVFIFLFNCGGRESNPLLLIFSQMFCHWTTPILIFWTVWDLNPSFCRERATSLPTRRTVYIYFQREGFEPSFSISKTDVLPIRRSLVLLFFLKIVSIKNYFISIYRDITKLF